MAWGGASEEFDGSSMLMLSEPLARCGSLWEYQLASALLRGVPEPPIPYHSETGCPHTQKWW